MPVKTNIKYKIIEPHNPNPGEKTWDDITEDLNANSIVILDNIMGEGHYGEFNNYYVKGDLIPLNISVSWNLGGGPALIAQAVSIFTNPISNFYLPTIAINLAMTPVYDKAISVIIGLITRLKKNHKTRRPRVAFYDKSGKFTTYEFPSFASIKDVEKGLKDIPNYSNKAKNKSYFIRDIKSNRWVKES